MHINIHLARNRDKPRTDTLKALGIVIPILAAVVARWIYHHRWLLTLTGMALAATVALAVALHTRHKARVATAKAARR